MRELLTVPNDTLKSVCKPVESIDSEVKSLAEDLKDYMVAHCEDKIAPVSIAAPQLGGSIRVIAFYPNTSYRKKEGIDVLINPELVKADKFIILKESCLSIPGKQFSVRRAKRVKVRGLNIYGKFKSYKAVGLLAQMLQHEIDHLNGKLIDEIGGKVQGGEI